MTFSKHRFGNDVIVGTGQKDVAFGLFGISIIDSEGILLAGSISMSSSRTGNSCSGAGSSSPGGAPGRSFAEALV